MTSDGQVRSVANEDGANDLATYRLEFGTIYNHSKAVSPITNYIATANLEQDILDYTNGQDPVFRSHIKGLIIIASTSDTLGQTSSIGH